MRFRECCITHESREESLDGVGCLPVSACVQIIGDVLEFLFVAICFRRRSTTSFSLTPALFRRTGQTILTVVAPFTTIRFISLFYAQVAKV